MRSEQGYTHPCTHPQVPAKPSSPLLASGVQRGTVRCTLFHEQAMCGRVRLEADYTEIKIPFRIPKNQPALTFEMCWNGVRTLF